MKGVGTRLSMTNIVHGSPHKRSVNDLRGSSPELSKVSVASADEGSGISNGAAATRILRRPIWSTRLDVSTTFVF